MLVAFLAMLLGVTAARAEGPGQAETDVVRIGYLRHACGPWTARIADGGFDKATGRKLHWQAFDTDSAIAEAMVGGRVHVGLIGIGVAAATYARGVDLRVFFVMGRSSESEGLLLANDALFKDGDARTLARKVIAVPFGSTQHLRLLDSWRTWNLDLQDIRLVNLQVPQITSAWKRREIDAAVVAQPMLGRLSSIGRAVALPRIREMDGLLVLVADASFVARQAVFLSRIIDLVARSQQAFGALAPALSDIDSELARSVALAAGIEPAEAAMALRRNHPPPLDQQYRPEWLGGGGASEVAAAMNIAMETWRWSGRFTTQATRDFATAIAIDPLARALAYQR